MVDENREHDEAARGAEGDEPGKVGYVEDVKDRASEVDDEALTDADRHVQSRREARAAEARGDEPTKGGKTARATTEDGDGKPADGEGDRAGDAEAGKAGKAGKAGGDGDGDAGKAGDGEKPKKRRERKEDRFDREHRGRLDAEERLSATAKENEELKRKLAEREAADAGKGGKDKAAGKGEAKVEPRHADGTPDPQPSEDDIGTTYRTWEDYNRANTAWVARQAVREALAERDEQDRKAKEKAGKADGKGDAGTDAERRPPTAEEDRILDLYEDVLDEIAEFKKDHEDFDAVVDKVGKDDWPGPMRLAILEMDPVDGLDNTRAAVYYFLATDPAESKRIAGLSGAKQGQALERLAQRLAAGASGAASDDDNKQRPRVKAIQPVAGGARSATPLSSSEMDHDEYVDRRRRDRARERSTRQAGRRGR